MNLLSKPSSSSQYQQLSDPTSAPSNSTPQQADSASWALINDLRQDLKCVFLLFLLLLLRPRESEG